MIRGRGWQGRCELQIDRDLHCMIAISWQRRFEMAREKLASPIYGNEGI